MDETKSTSSPTSSEFIPSSGLLHFSESDSLILCKPKLMPLKSVTLEKLDKMKSEAEKKLKEHIEKNE